MKFITNAAVLLAATAIVAACGGGGGGGINVASSTTSVPVTVIDGPIKNAKVCLDLNLNGTCDAGEPSGTTDANGLTTLTVNNSDVGKFPVLAIVDTNAIDADTGAVTTRYAMKAPADAAVVVSPLTTLVQVQAETFSQTTAQAAASVALTTGLNSSKLTSDYTKDTSVSGSAAYAIAQAVVVAVQKQAALTQSGLGTTAIDGSTITQSNLDNAVVRAATAMLTSIISNVSSSNSVTSAATPKDRLIAIQNLIDTTFLSSNGGITTSAGAQVVVGVSNTAASQASNNNSTYTPAATASLASFTYTDASHWYARISQKTLAEAALDANNTYKYRWGHYRNDGGGPVAWGGNGSYPYRGADLHWNGTTWANCPINFQNSQTAPDANGLASYNYCDSLEIGTVNTKAPTSASFDVSGLSINSVYLNKISAANFGNIKIANNNVAQVNTLLGAAVFPVGSRISYVTDTSGTNAIGYYPSAGNPGKDNTVILASVPDAVGGDFTQSSSVQTGCLPNTASTTPASKLEDLVARSKGTPCKFANASVVGLNGINLTSSEGGQTRNENWGNTTLNIGNIGTASVPGVSSSATSYYTGNTRVRVAFAANNVANFYTCQERYDGSPRNCNFATTGSYSVNSLSDGSRVLTFDGVPPIAAGLGWVRVYVERNSLIYYGYKNLPSTGVSARLNKPALDALFAQLGLNTESIFNGLNGGFNPASTISLNELAYAGTYVGAISAIGYSSGSFIVARNTDGTNSCSGVNTFLSPATSGKAFTCTVTVTPGNPDSTVALFVVNTSDGTVASGTLNYYTGVISSGTWTSSIGLPSSGNFTGSRL